MSKQAHTPGPWTIERPYGEPGLFVSRGDPAATNPLICKVREGLRTGEPEANARLIAAAPDLLEVVQAIDARLHGRFDDPALLSMGPLNTNPTRDILTWTGRAITKATGGRA